MEHLKEFVMFIQHISTEVNIHLHFRGPLSNELTNLQSLKFTRTFALYTFGL